MNITKQIVHQVASEAIYMLDTTCDPSISLDDFRMDNNRNQAEFHFMFTNMFNERAEYLYVISGNKANTINELVVRLWTRMERTIRVHNECAKRYRGLE